jgi:hypothetical protein
MRNKTLQHQITTGRFTLPVVIFVCTLCWVLAYSIVPNLVPPADNAPELSLWQQLSAYLPNWVERIISYLIYAVIGYFLIELNNRFTIIRMRASMQTVIYFLMVTVCPEMHLLYAGDFAALAFLIGMFFLFSSYQQTHSSSYLFYSFFSIGVGSLLFPQLTFLSVLWLLEAYRLQSLNPRSFFAALIGWMLPYWFLLGHALYHGQMDLFYQPFRELMVFGKPFDLRLLQPWELAILPYLLVLILAAAGHSVAAGFEDKIRTRAYLWFLVDQTLFFFIVILIQPIYCSDLLPQLMICSSILIGHFFVLTNSKASNLFFILAILALIFLLGFNIWTLS